MKKELVENSAKITNLELQSLLKRAYIKLADYDDICKGNDCWQSDELKKLLTDIANTLAIPENDRL
jgi:hypothetical protein